MKKKTESKFRVTDAVITGEYGFSNEFDHAIKSWLEGLAKMGTKYDNMSDDWKENTFAYDFLRKAKRLFEDKKPLFDDAIETMYELRSLIGEHVNCRMFLLMLQMTTAIYRAGFIPEMAQIGKRHSNEQAIKAKNPRSRNNITPKEREKRNQKILDHYKMASEEGKISLNGFAKKYQKKYSLSPTAIKNIITSKVST